MKLADVNKLSGAAFEQAFGDIAEHSPWVARYAMLARPFTTRDIMIEAFASALMTADRAAQLDLLCAHPDLATRAKLTQDSTKEQAGVGLDALDAAEFAHFTELNNAYRAKNGFPFIFAVKGATKHQILEAFKKRIQNESGTEFQMALSQVCRIIRFRLEDKVDA